MVNATAYSLAGLAAAVRYEPAFQGLLGLLLVSTPIALWLGKNGVERALLIGSVMLALVAEILNAAVEAAIDRISLERHPIAKRAKDLGSAAVMVALLTAAAVWALVILS